jgi:hypothetical protein
MPDSYELHLRQIARAKMANQKTKPSDQSVVHTPGPWEAVRSLTCGHLRAAHNYQVDPKEEWTDADLKLISAAPEMLKALRRIVRHQDCIGGSMASMSSTRHMAAQAIQHATGEVV